MHFESTLLEAHQRKRAIGLLVLEADEVLEGDFRRRFDAERVDIHVSRVSNPREINLDNLKAMASQLVPAASLLPQQRQFDVVAYGCTSGSAVMGSDTVHQLVESACQTRQTTNPLHALLWMCRQHHIRRIALLSPYVESVNATLRTALQRSEIEVPRFGSFNISDDACVARIDGESIRNAAHRIMETAHTAEEKIDALFLSCTNLQAAPLLETLEAELALPVWSSNHVLANRVEAVLRQEN